MSIREKIKAGFARFAQGRNGMDNLGMFMFFTGLFLQLLDSVLGIGVLYIPGTALYVWALSACSPEILLSYLQVASAAGARVGRKNARMLKVQNDHKAKSLIDPECPCSNFVHGLRREDQ